nr:MAG TPA: major tail protein [Caudoviricetes sp.]
MVNEKPFTGLTAQVKIGESASAKTLAYISGCTLSLSKDIIEILAFGMEYKEKVPSIKDWTLSIDGTVALAEGGTQKELYDAFESGDMITLGIYLDDNTYFDGKGYVSSFEMEAAPDDKISLSSEISGNGATVMHLGAA